MLFNFSTAKRARFQLNHYLHLRPSLHRSVGNNPSLHRTLSHRRSNTEYRPQLRCEKASTFHAPPAQRRRQAHSQEPVLLYPNQSLAPQELSSPLHGQCIQPFVTSIGHHFFLVFNASGLSRDISPNPIKGYMGLFLPFLAPVILQPEIRPVFAVSVSAHFLVVPLAIHTPSIRMHPHPPPKSFSLTMQLQLPLQHISYTGRISVKRPSNLRKTATVEPHFACLCFISFRPHPNHFRISQVFGYVPNGLHTATHLLSNICSAHTVLIHTANMLLFFGVQPIRFAGFAITGFQMPHTCKMGR